jgi:hypothetical protein
MKVVKARSLDRHDRKRFVELENEEKARLSLDRRRAHEFEALMAAATYIDETWSEQKKRK